MNTNTLSDMLPLRASPHAHDKSSVDRIMLKVCLALAPATAWGLYLFGWPAIILFCVTLMAAVATEALCLYLAEQPLTRVLDGSALLSGWLYAMTLPPWAPWWIGAGGIAFALAIGKHLYGGIGQNPFNPAMLARVAVLISFPVYLTTWVNPMPLGSELAPGFVDSLGIIFNGMDYAAHLTAAQTPVDGMTGASWLGSTKAAIGAGTDISVMIGDGFSLTDAFFGNMRGSLGETSALLVLLGGLWMIRARIISWHIPVSFLGMLALCAWLASHFNGHLYPGPLFQLTTGAAMLGAFFIATDYVTSPATPVGKLIFGAGCGLMLFTIRSWSGFPEGVAFAVLFMNALTPLIDRAIKPRAYGRTIRGESIKHSDMRKII